MLRKFNLNRSLCLFVVCLGGTNAPFVSASAITEERITVVGKKPEYLQSLDSILPVTLIEARGLQYASSLADIFDTAPEVNFNGQGGLFQTISIRGLSRWRIRTLVEGIPIHTERRAGNAAEFIAPSLVGSAYVLSGAASTQLGSGALGGGVDLQLATTTENELNIGYGLLQDYRSIQLLGGQQGNNNGIYWGASLRHANDGRDGVNQPLFNGFEQSVGWIRHVNNNSFIKEALVIVSTANNVGKANADPVEQRRTIYPDNDHWLAKLNFNWLNAQVYAHNARLNTEITRPGQRTNILHNRALGWGASIGDEFMFSRWQFNWRAALDARSGVEASEQEKSAADKIVFDRINLAGYQHAWSLMLDTRRYLNSWEIAAGLRAEYIRQHSDANISQDATETSFSGFLGGKKRWSAHWSTGLYVSQGYRVPTLTERFFSGSTPRGITLGDPGLKPERALNLQADLAYQGETSNISFSVFHQSIDDYIERLGLTPSLLQYARLDNAIIAGASYTVDWFLSSSTNLRIQGQWLEGEGEQGETINDVSPHQHDARLGWQSDTQTAWLNISYRAAHRNPGSSEIETARTVDFSAGYEKYISPSTKASIVINNITNKNFPTSTDDLAANAQGRDIQLNLTFTF